MSKAGTNGTGELVVVPVEPRAIEAESEVVRQGPGAACAGPVRRDERGMISAEWAVGLIAAIAIAGVLLAVVTDGAVKAGLLAFILRVIRAFAGDL